MTILAVINHLLSRHGARLVIVEGESRRQCDKEFLRKMACSVPVLAAFSVKDLVAKSEEFNLSKNRNAEELGPPRD